MVAHVMGVVELSQRMILKKDIKLKLELYFFQILKDTP